jgi:hypothetical protein
MLWGVGESSKRAAEAAAAADLDAHLAGPPTAGPLSVAKLDALDYWAREIVVVEQVTTFTAPVASLRFLEVPAEAVILAVQANLETAITGAGGAVKVGIGTSASLNKYGQTTGLTKNLKIIRTPDWAFLAPTETLQFAALRANNNPGGTIGPPAFGPRVERIRTRVLYLNLPSLPDAP